MGRGGGRSSHDHHLHPPSSSTSCDGDHHDQKVVVNKATGGGLKRGPWTPEEDQKLLAHIEKHGHGSWRSLPSKAGLERCGKSCRLRWTNYLRPDIKRGKFSPAEEQTIIQLHALLGNRWSAIATHLPKRTDNEIKNYWNTHLKKRLTKMGIDPVTHKPKSATLSLSSIDGQTNKTESNLNHMAQWEGARLEAEARLVRESKLRSIAIQQHHQLGSSSSSSALPYLSKSTKDCTVDQDIDSTTSTLTNSENSLPILTVGLKEQVENHHQEGLKFSFTSSLHGDDMLMFPLDKNQFMISTQPESPRNGNENVPFMNFMDRFTDELLVDPDAGKQSSSDGISGGSDNHNGDDQCSGTDHNSGYEEENKNYWNEILNLVNSTSPSDDSPVF